MILDKRIADSTVFIAELSISNLYLQNESRFPWFVLVPRKANVSEIIDLTEDEQQQLMSEIALVSELMHDKFQPTKLNVANLGNIVPQLHVHIVARFESDAAWPDPIWGKFSQPIVYDEQDKQKIINDFKELLIERAL